jgi:molybdopterin-guanine dinucleotide biosynthesis protein
VEAHTGRPRQWRVMRRTIVAVGGFTSNSGKTTLVCELLRALGGWEAIKMTRGHYRSCGKDPHACCVSHLLGDEPVVRSGRAETYAPGKDTGRYWEAGASNVHWAVVTDRQVERGVALALARVQAPGVIVEGNSFLRFVEADFTLMVARPDGAKIKPSARRALPGVSAIYLSGDARAADSSQRARFEEWRRQAGLDDQLARVPVFSGEDLTRIVAQIRALQTQHEKPSGLTASTAARLS